MAQPSFFDTMVAAQMASGGQNVVTPQNMERIMGLAAQQEAQRRLALAAGRQAVQEKKAEQEMFKGRTPGEIAGTTIVAPSGARFVTDQQGNLVGTTAKMGIPGPLTYGKETEAEAKAAFNRGESTAEERELFRNSFMGTNRDLGLLRETFTNEMQKRRPVQAVPVPEETPPVAPPQPPTPPQEPTPSEADVQRMQVEKKSLEDLFSTSGVATKEELAEGKSRESLYKQIQELEKLKEGPGQEVNMNPYGLGPKTWMPMTPEQRAGLTRQQDVLRQRIRESGGKGGRQAKLAEARAVPAAEMEKYRALLAALERAKR